MLLTYVSAFKYNDESGLFGFADIVKNKANIAAKNWGTILLYFRICNTKVSKY
jgi:hypothetical protein